MRKPAGFLAWILSAAAAWSCCLPDAFRAGAADFALAKHTPAEIRAYYQAHPWKTGSWDDRIPYASAPSYKSPYALGKITDAAQKEALNTLNFCRYVAGLPADITAKSSYVEMAQAASLVNAANGTMSHFPAKPAGMSDSLYQKGKQGAGESNLGWNYSTIPNAVIDGYMCDSDDYNIPMVGHRRWVLNPSMLYSGFGAAGAYTAMYAFDGSRKDRFTGDYIAWPAENMPYELYGISDRYVFSVSLTGGYDAPKKSAVKIDMTSKKRGKTYHIDSSSLTNKRYLSVNNDGYGIDKCIIFYPGVQFPKDDTVTVKISGITKSGKASPLTYTVSFFSLYQADEPAVTQISQKTEPKKTETRTTESEKQQTTVTKQTTVTQKTVPVTTTTAVTTEPVQTTASETVLPTAEDPGTAEWERDVTMHTPRDKIKLTFLPKSGEILNAVLRYPVGKDGGGNEIMRSVVMDYGSGYPLVSAPDTLTVTIELNTVICGKLRLEAEYTGEKPDAEIEVIQAPPAEPGDLNGSGEIDIADVVYLVRLNAEDKDIELTDEGLAAADVNRDGVTDAVDVRLLLIYLATMVKNF